MTFLVRYWRPLALVAGLVLAFAVGRYTTPGPDVVIAQSIRFVERKVEVVRVEKAKTRIVYRDVTVRPDGTRIDRSVESSATDTRRDARVATDRDSASNTKSTVTAYKPQWRVGALLGLNVGGIKFPSFSIAPEAFAWGAVAERRLIGPVWLGLWGLSAGPSFGLTLSVEF